MKANASLDDLQLFYQVAQHGGLSAASQITGVATATLSRRLKSLEQALGCRLLERSAHHFALTAMGRHYFNQCGPLLNDLQAVTQALEINHHRLSGTLKITAPVSMTQRWLGRCFFDFMQAYPDIHLQLVLSNQFESLIEQEFDAALRVGEPRQQDWIARHVWTTHMGFCASSAYLAESAPIKHPQDLLQHKLVVADPINEWDLVNGDTGERFLLNAPAHFRCNDIHLALGAVAANMGVSLVPNYYFVGQGLAGAEPERQLVPVLPEWQGRHRAVYLLYRDREVMPARLRVFIDFVVDWMEQNAKF
jgi:LysR family transcriptional regulator, transcriptional activator AphB